MCPTNLLLVRHTCCLGKPIAEPSTRTIGSANARSHGLLWTLQSVCAPSLAVTSRQCRCWAPLVTRGGGCAITISPGSDILAKTAAFCSVLFMRWNPKLRSNLMHAIDSSNLEHAFIDQVARTKNPCKNRKSMFSPSIKTSQST